MLVDSEIFISTLAFLIYWAVQVLEKKGNV